MFSKSVPWASFVGMPQCNVGVEPVGFLDGLICFIGKPVCATVCTDSFVAMYVTIFVVVTESLFVNGDRFR